MKTNSHTLKWQMISAATLFAFLMPQTSLAQVKDSTKTKEIEVNKEVVKKEINGKHVKILIYDKTHGGDSTVVEQEIEIFDPGADENKMVIRMQKSMERAEDMSEEVMEAFEDSIEKQMEAMEKEIEEMVERAEERAYDIELEEKHWGNHCSEECTEGKCVHKHGGQRPKLVEQSWFVMDLGWNVWLTDNTFELPEGYKEMELDRGRSVNFHLGILQQGVNLYRGQLRFVYGIGIEFNNYRFRNNIDLVDESSPLAFAINTDQEYKKNKVVSQYATMPLMLNYKTKSDDDNESFKLAGGIQLGYLISSNIKQKWGEDGKKEKRREKGDYNFEDYRLGYVIQFGYGDLNIYAKYYPTTVFKSGQGPLANTACLGLVLTPF